MSCCGRDRTTYPRTSPGPAPLASSGSAKVSTAAPPPPRSGLSFEYVGATGMTVQGPVTGRIYRFDHPGARLTVDPRDAAAVAAVPHLRRL